MRRIEERDLPQLFAWRNCEAVHKWCRQVGPLHWDNHLRWYKAQSQRKDLDMFIVDDIGVVGLTDIDMLNRRAEFSCYVAPEAQGKGHAVRLLKDLFKYGFYQLGLNRIWGETFEGNFALDIFVNKLGMEHEGTRRDFYFRDGGFIHAHLVSINRDAFDKLQGSEPDEAAIAKAYFDKYFAKPTKVPKKI